MLGSSLVLGIGYRDEDFGEFATTGCLHPVCRPV
jgi:hypothetical protein